MSLDPNETQFSFQKGHQVEMRFNRTETGDPVVSPFNTPEDLLDRCSFWQSVGSETGQ
ncbi:uncharacterized protein EV420DRAFT_1519146 [Desarmillaria tabescens]|uniref:Uncharacterized protein n=1 Tax=Armillaria tabescens TaxID=1929756 RepID=A0AA39NDF3_ARMTA|nr:uncharacterized protein EV420DRAFT_1519146 [Desarmillaria tabescens]KAK0463612.1 hypothetical protein EV420DRAFT_1519146 [Desarmillaria tabescens]